VNFSKKHFFEVEEFFSKKNEFSKNRTEKNHDLKKSKKDSNQIFFNLKNKDKYVGLLNLKNF